jgi:GT2 family glycosyltransferase
MDGRPNVSGAPRVSVIVPHYADLAGLETCLAALERQTFPRTLFEIVVSDNGSPDGEAAVARVIAGRARLTVTRERGAGPARNGGVAQARGPILAFTDSDCQPEPGWLEGGLAALGDHDFVGGRMVVAVADPAHPSPSEAFERLFAFDNARYVRRKGFTVTANLFCLRAMFDAVGGFRTGVSEDIEWCWRARSQGYRLGYAPAAAVCHPARRSWPALVGKWRRMNDEQYRLMAADRAGRIRWLFRSCLLPASIPAHLPRILLSSELTSIDQKLEVACVLVRLRLWRFADSLRLFAGRP